MNERARTWIAVLGDENIERGSHRELSFIKKTFSGVRTRETFGPYLSNGFPLKHEPALKRLLGDRYDPATWLVERKAAFGASDRNRSAVWFGDPIVDMEDFCESLRVVYQDAITYAYLRVGGSLSGNRTPIGDVDDRGLAIIPKRAGVRMTYVKPVWARVTSGELCGTSVHVLKSVDRLVELWAAVVLLRRRDRHEKNSVYLMEFDDVGRPGIDPVMGVRIVNGDKVLLSLLPAGGEDTPPYSDWVRSRRLGEFAEQAVMRARVPPARKLSSLLAPQLEEVMEEAFEGLMKSGIDCSRNYGPLDNFDNVRIIKDRMADWPDELWLPPLG